MLYTPAIQRPEPPPPPRLNRYKTSLACTTCRRRKLKCDGRRPVCARCQNQDHLQQGCKYIRNIDRSGPFYQAQQASNNAPTPPLPPALAISGSKTTESLAAVPECDVHNDVIPVELESRFRATLDARLGLPVANKRCPIPLIDAPLFGEGLSRNQAAAGGMTAGAESVLPQRKHADQLMDLYWRHLEPLDPLFDQSGFSHAYQALFTGDDLGCDERVFCSTLNIMFALSTQLQESLPPELRDETSKTFFQRAWSLLRPEVVMWSSGSVDVVQCLILMARYLQCTRNLNQTWMAVGSAVRVAQHLGLHTPATRSPSAPRDRDGWIGQQVWQSCASMDRALSWTLGQIPITISIGSPMSIDFRSNDMRRDHIGQYAAKMAELNEIISYIMFSQAPPHNSIADSLELPPLVRTTTDMSAVAQIDNRLDKFEKSLVIFWDAETGQKDARDCLSNGQRALFSLRLAHARILLLRPFLARFCLPQGLSTPEVQGLEAQILQSSATLCVENVQRMVMVVCDDCRPRDNTTASLDGLVLPWWHRIFYLHLAMQHLIVAMMRPSAFQHMVVDYWQKSLSALCTEEHLSPSITRCITSFRTMWQKVADMRSLTGTLTAPETYQDLFQHLGFETDGQNLLNLGSGDASGMAGMANFDWDDEGNCIGTDLI